jgi:hypothetical protein
MTQIFSTNSYLSLWVSAQTSSCPLYPPDNFLSTSFALSFMPCRLPENGFKVVSEDVLSYLCTLAMQKCGKKSEKKRAACGGAAMRKRLLIKNFVAQMLQQDRPLVYFDEGLDLHYGKSEDDQHDESEKQHQNHQKVDHNKVEQGHYGGKPNKKGSLSDDSESDEEEVEEEEDPDEEDEHDQASDEEDEDYDDSIYDDNGTTALSMVHRQTDISHYGDSSNLFYSTDDQHRSIPTTPLPSASTLCSGNSSMEIWGDDGTDSYSLLSLNSSQCRSFNDPMMAAQDENLFYSCTNYQSSYMMSSGTTENHQTQVSLGGYMTVDQSNVVNDGFIEDVTLCDKLDKLNDNFVSSDDEVSLSNGTSFTSLVNMNSPVKIGNQSFDDPNLLLAYRRSITDLDTNTVVEEDDFNTDNSTTSSLNNAVRSPKKRPHSFAQDDFMYNLTLSSSPKRLKL